MDFKSLASEAQKALSDLDFPARKSEVVQHAQERGASGETVDTLRQLPDREYGGVSEVMDKLPLGAADDEIENFF